MWGVGSVLFLVAINDNFFFIVVLEKECCVCVVRRSELVLMCLSKHIYGR